MKWGIGWWQLSDVSVRGVFRGGAMWAKPPLEKFLNTPLVPVSRNQHKTVSKLYQKRRYAKYTSVSPRTPSNDSAVYWSRDTVCIVICINLKEFKLSQNLVLWFHPTSCKLTAGEGGGSNYCDIDDKSLQPRSSSKF